MIVVSDTSVLTNLAAIQHLSLLRQLYHQVLIPEAVFQELMDSGSAVPGALDVQSANWLQVRRMTTPNVFERLLSEVRLDPGESEAITLALELKADLLLIDDRRGRAEANRLGLRIIGLLGILVEAKHKHLIASVKPLLDAMMTTSAFRVSPALYSQILDRVDEL